jgi:hypothetical protein
MKGIYIENTVYKMEDLSSREVDALRTLGITFTLDLDNQVIKIVEDTHEQDHQLCGDEDAIALVKGHRCPEQ